ncbi:hypothetical protein BKA62DRAFT_692280 [Auriculariales sp. MPI-PUGE-AT-0066]|nr:hypothetical protein BKA62DRAFT_692280 [Auriculariales sp. MPI-PUGE-AT-0066]
MPKATTSSQPSLRRNQACRQCRKRKLKCDAQRPHCGTCVKQWHAQTSVPPPVGFSHPVEPLCSYDPLDGTALVAETYEDQTDRIRQLETQIAELQLRLTSNSPPGAISPPQHAYSLSPAHSASSLGLHHARSPSDPGYSPPTVHQGPRISTGDIRVSHGDEQKYSPRADIVLPQVSLNIPVSSFPASDPSPIEITSHQLFTGTTSSIPYAPLIYSGWNRDLPDPVALNHLVDTYFRCDPCTSRIFHRGSFIASLILPPTHPDFPHPAILHAMCASASRWTSPELQFTAQPRRRDRFAEFHAKKARSYIDSTMSSGSQIFSVLQACIVLSWWFYAEGRWVEVWIFAGFQCRAAIPLGLNFPKTHPTRSTAVYLEPPRDDRDLELRRRAWWMSIVFDRLVSAGGFVHAVDERDIGTELQLRQVDFDSDDMFQVGSNPQSLLLPGFFTSHPPNHTDSSILLIKAAMLFGKVSDYNTRVNIQNVPRSAAGDRRLGREFQELDALVRTFSTTFPPGYKNYLAPGDVTSATSVDTDLYTAHLIPHAVMITLHSPHLNTTDPGCPSVAACIAGSRQIIEAYYLLATTSFDITRLHPFIVTIWYLAAVVQVHLCKSMIQLGDTVSENAVWGEINLIRMALLQYGSLSPIGIRQEKMLRDAMSEILSMTTQSAPLDVKMPLYPRSTQAVFNVIKTEEGHLDVASAPLPHFSEEETPLSASPPMQVSPNLIPSISSVAQHHAGADIWQSQQQQQQQQQSPPVMQLPQVPQVPQMAMHMSGQQVHMRSNSYGGGY